MFNVTKENKIALVYNRNQGSDYDCNLYIKFYNGKLGTFTGDATRVMSLYGFKSSAVGKTLIAKGDNLDAVLDKNDFSYNDGLKVSFFEGMDVEDVIEILSMYAFAKNKRIWIRRYDIAHTNKLEAQLEESASNESVNVNETDAENDDPWM